MTMTIIDGRTYMVTGFGDDQRLHLVQSDCRQPVNHIAPLVEQEAPVELPEYYFALQRQTIQDRRRRRSIRNRIIDVACAFGLLFTSFAAGLVAGF